LTGFFSFTLSYDTVRHGEAMSWLLHIFSESVLERADARGFSCSDLQAVFNFSLDTNKINVP